MAGYIFMRGCSASPNEIREHALLDIHEIFCLSRVSVIVFVRRNGSSKAAAWNSAATWPFLNKIFIPNVSSIFPERASALL